MVSSTGSPVRFGSTLRMSRPRPFWFEIDASSVWTGVEARDRHLRSPDFFDVEKFPVIRFKSTGVEVAGSNFMTVHGELTVRDVTRPILLQAALFGPMQYHDETGSYTTMAFSAAATRQPGRFRHDVEQSFRPRDFMVGKHIELLWMRKPICCWKPERSRPTVNRVRAGCCAGCGWSDSSHSLAGCNDKRLRDKRHRPKKARPERGETAFQQASGRI